MRQPYRRVGWPTIAGPGLVVVAFMVLSLLVTATGTARFAVAMGYDARVGYAVGAIFDIAKGILPVALLALSAHRAFGAAIPLGIAWICLVTFSCLATQATVGTAISSIERTGSWKMEMRGNAKAELSNIEQQLAEGRIVFCTRMSPLGRLSEGERAFIGRTLEGASLTASWLGGTASTFPVFVLHCRPGNTPSAVGFAYPWRTHSCHPPTD